MPYTVLEKKLRMISEEDFDFVSHFLDMVLANEKIRSQPQTNKNNEKYESMLNNSFAQLERGEVVVKSMSELRAMEQC